MSKENLARKVVDFWIYHTFTSNHSDAGSDDGVMNLLLAVDKRSKQINTNEDDIKRFDKALFNFLMADDDNYITLRVDYGPGVNMRAVLNAAKIKEAPFPVKTTTIMSVSEGTSRAKLGYGGEWVVL